MEPEKVNESLKIIMDANAFFVPLKFKIDIAESLNSLLDRRFELVVLSPIIDELEKLAEKGPTKVRKEASYAIRLAEKCRIFHVCLDPENSPDDVIIKVARELGSPVFTNDRQLRKKLRDINVPVIYVRQKSRLEIDGRI